MKEIYDRLKYLRKEILKKTQGEFGQSIGLSRSNIANIENNRITLTDRNIGDICREFGISEHWLRTGEGVMYQTASSTTTDLLEIVGEISYDKNNPLMAEVLLLTAKAMKNMTSEQWETVKKYIKTLSAMIDEKESKK